MHRMIKLIVFIFNWDKHSGYFLAGLLWRSFTPDPCLLILHKISTQRASSLFILILGSIVVSIPACHAGDRGSIPRRGGVKTFLTELHPQPFLWFLFFLVILYIIF